MVMIPPKWWHQVYHLQPSVALAAQYMNDQVTDNVINHILSWTNVNREMEIPKNFAEMSILDKILETIKCGLIRQHGLKVGTDMYNDIIIEQPF